MDKQPSLLRWSKKKSVISLTTGRNKVKCLDEEDNKNNLGKSDKNVQKSSKQQVIVIFLFG